jgi:hypothetical protein
VYSLKKFKLSDYEELVDMFYEFTKECYKERKIGLRYRFYEKVNQWIDNKYDIILGMKEDKIVGFTMCYIDMSGLTEPVYVGEIAYIKPEYRKSKISYMIYNNVVEYAKQLNMILVSNSRVDNGVDKMIKKHYNVKQKYIQFELRS